MINDSEKSIPQSSEALKRALVALKDLRSRVDAVERAKTEPIAVIGIGCRFPGGANNPALYWQLLKNGRDAITEVPADRWDINSYYDSDPDAPGKTYTRWGGFIDQVDQFDPQFFGISPREAVSLDPQQRLLLEVSWEALEHAGLAPDKLSESQTGVYVGMSANDYAQMQFEAYGFERINPYMGTGGMFSVAAGRVAFALGLHGPTMTVDTACSSSLVTVHLACQSLRNGQSDLALAGGVNLILSPMPHIYLSRLKAMAADGRCKAFDAAADGFVRGEGCGMVVLKRLSDALSDGDNILAIIRSSAINHDGQSSGLTVPNGLAQQAVIRRALQEAGELEPIQLRYVETHGTGTPLGDPIEARALSAVMSKGRSKDDPLLIGSVKTNIGHLESAAGIAALIKVVLSFENDEIPPSLHFNNPNPFIDWADMPLKVVTERTPLEAGDEPNRASVSAFGFSGTNAHIILEEPPQLQSSPDGVDRPIHIICLSTRSENSVRQLASDYAKHIELQPEQTLADIALTANAGRSLFSHRLAVVAKTREEIIRNLTRFVAGQKAPGVINGFTEGGRHPRVAFLFTGQGSQYVGMGRQLYETQPAFRTLLDQCDEILQPYLPQPLLSVIFPEGGKPDLLDDTTYTQPALFAIEYALAKLWQSWGIEPDLVMGHSIGEYVAACIAGIVSLEDGLKLVVERARLMGSLPPGGQMAAIFAGEIEVLDAINNYQSQISIASINGPENVVISGDGSAIEAICQTLSDQKIRSRVLNVSHAFHSPLMEPILDEFKQVAEGFSFSEPQIRLISNVTGQLAGDEISTPEYWRQHARQAVRFTDTIETLESLDCDIYLEIGPSPTLIGMAQRCLPKTTSVQLLPSLRKGFDDWELILESLGALYASGVSINWQGFERDYAHKRRRVILPTYPFERQSYWFDEASTNSLTSAKHRSSGLILHPLIGARIYTASKDFLFDAEIGGNTIPYLNDHQVYGIKVFPAMGFVEIFLAAAKYLFQSESCLVENMEIVRALTLPEVGTQTIQVVVTPESEVKAFCQVFSQVTEGQDQIEWVLHATAKIDVEQTPPVPVEHSLTDLQSRIDQELDLSSYYDRIRELGIFYGPSFRGLKRLWISGNEVLGEINLPEEIAQSLPKYQLHPALLDACLHPLGAALKDATIKNETLKNIYLPTGFQRLKFHHDGGIPSWSHITIIPQKETEIIDADVGFTANLHLFDSSGQLVLDIEKMQFILTQRESLQRAIQGSADDMVFQIEWQSKIWTAPETTPRPRTWLIFADQGGFGDALGRKITTNGERCQIVYASADQKITKPNQHYVNPLNFQTFIDLLNQFYKTEELTDSRIVFLWGLDIELTRDNLSQSLGCKSVLHLLKALSKTDIKNDTRLWLVTRGAQAVGDEQESLSVMQSPLWGLGRVIANEHPGIWGGMVDLDPSEPLDATEPINNSLFVEDGEDQIAVRKGQRFVARLMPKFLPKPKTQKLILRDDVTYLITGGSGGLGLLTAEWMAKQGARFLVLVNRSKPSELALQTIDQLGQLGVQCRTIQADVSKPDDVSRILREIDKSMAPLKGIIHAAGVLKDGLLINLDWKSFEDVFAPKISGAWNLATQTQGMALDFFVMFSSVASTLGSSGQGNYAAANAFLDGLAHYRHKRGLPTLTINWGAWSQVGMAAKIEDRLKSIGVGVISPDEGLRILETSIGQIQSHRYQVFPQMMVMPVKWKPYLQQFPGEIPPLYADVAKEIHEDKKSEVGKEYYQLVQKLKTASVEKQKEIIREYLASLIREILRLSPADNLPTEVPIIALGIDSLMTVELKNRMELDLGVEMQMAQLLAGPSMTQLTDAVDIIFQESGGELTSQAEVLDESWEEGEL